MLWRGPSEPMRKGGSNVNKCILALLAVAAVIVNAVLFTRYGAALIAAAAAQPVAAALALVGLAFLWLASVYVMYKVLRKGCYN